MAQMTRPEFLAAMTRLRAMYSNAVRDESHWAAQVATYWEALRGYDGEELRAAFAVAWRRHPEWFPSCGQLDALVGGECSTRAADAWPEVLRLASRSSGEHSDPVAREAIRLMGGGPRLGRMQSAELEGWGRREFMRCYDEANKIRQRSTAKALGAGPSDAQDARALVSEVSTRLEAARSAQSHRGPGAACPSAVAACPGT